MIPFSDGLMPSAFFMSNKFVIEGRKHKLGSMAYFIVPGYIGMTEFQLRAKHNKNSITKIKFNVHDKYSYLEITIFHIGTFTCVMLNDVCQKCYLFFDDDI